MARNQTLLKLLNDVRAEARLSLNPAHNIADRDAQIILIQREQERLWAEHDWPHLVVDRYIPLIAGQRFYDPRTAFNDALEPKTDLSMERLLSVSLYDGDHWCRLDNGIGDRDRMLHNPLTGDRSSPVRRWARGEDDVIEVWPVPDTAAVLPTPERPSPVYDHFLRIRGVRDLRPLVDDDDRADLDDRLLVLYCAAAILAESGAKDTNLKLEAAQRHFARLKADQVQSEPFSLFGVRRQPLRERRFAGSYTAVEREPYAGTNTDYAAIFEKART